MGLFQIKLIIIVIIIVRTERRTIKKDRKANLCWTFIISNLFFSFLCCFYFHILWWSLGYCFNNHKIHRQTCPRVSIRVPITTRGRWTKTAPATTFNWVFAFPRCSSINWTVFSSFPGGCCCLCCPQNKFIKTTVSIELFPLAIHSLQLSPDYRFNWFRDGNLCFWCWIDTDERMLQPLLPPVVICIDQREGERPSKPLETGQEMQ